MTTREPTTTPAPLPLWEERERGGGEREKARAAVLLPLPACLAASLPLAPPLSLPCESEVWNGMNGTEQTEEGGRDAGIIRVVGRGLSA